MRIRRRDQFEVYVARNEQQAHVIQAHLADHGIKAIVVGGQLTGGVGELPLGWEIAPRIWVAEVDRERAREMILAWERDVADTGKNEQPPWTCESCGESVTGTFNICWNCSADRQGLKQQSEDADTKE